MKKLSFVILLLLPLITFGQAQKVYKAVIIDSLKARTGGIIDVKDTLKHDIGIKFNDGTFQSTAAVAGGDGIYGGDGSLSNNPTVVTMGGNPLNFFGNQTGFRGINAAFGTRVALFEDNVGTNLVEINNNGSVGIGTDGFSSTRLTTKSATNDNASLSFIGQNLAGDFTFAVAGSGNIGFGTLSFLAGHKMAISEMNRMIFVNTDATTPISDIRWDYSGFASAIQYNNTSTPKRFDFLVGAGAPGLVFTLDEDNHAIVKGKLSTIRTAITLGAAATTFAITSNVMTMTGDGGGNTVATITGVNSGTLLTLIFTDANITITDDNSATANTVNLPANFSSATNKTLLIAFDGVSWFSVPATN